MTEVDPYAAPSAAAVLEADRARRKAIRASSQPYFTIGIVCMAGAVVVGSWGILVRSAQDAVVMVPFLICIGGLAHGIAGIRSARYIRRNPPSGQGPS